MKIYINSSTHFQYHSRIQSGAFLIALCSEKKSIGVELSSAELSSSDLASILDNFFQNCGDLKNIKVKYITNSLSKPLEAYLSQKNIQIEKAILIKNTFEILYFPSQSRMKFAEDAHSSQNEKIKVLIVDDSKTIRLLLENIFSSDPELEVVGSCEDPLKAENMIEELRPHVVTLDIHMPQMDGLTLLKRILLKFKMPVIMITSVNIEEGSAVIQALEEGAVDYIKKPTSNDLRTIKDLIIEKVKSAAKSNVRLKKEAQPRLLKKNIVTNLSQNRLIAIGSSTGGVDALRVLLTQLPENIPPILITQHIPPIFSKTFAERLNDLCAFEVREAKDGDEIKPGLALLAEGGKQFKIVQRSGKLYVVVNDDDAVNRHKPSVDYLFNSIAEVVGKEAIGVILTGMGADGAKGLLKMKQAGAFTIAQDEHSCIVFGMPKEAIKLGAVDVVLDIQDIPSELILALQKKKSA